MAEIKTPCGECGMPCAPGEFHPFAACLMFKASHSSEVVRANLDALAEAHQAEVARLTRERDFMRDALADVVDTDWAYLGRDADTGNPGSLYNRIRRGRAALAGASGAQEGERT